jgi:hypothetical protein
MANEMAMAIGDPRLDVNDQTRAQRALVQRILRVRPDVSPAQLVGILGGKMLDATRDRPTGRINR